MLLRYRFVLERWQTEHRLEGISFSRLLNRGSVEMRKRNRVLNKFASVYRGCLAKRPHKLITTFLKYRMDGRSGRTCDERMLPNIKEVIAEAQSRVDQLRLISGDAVQEKNWGEDGYD